MSSPVRDSGSTTAGSGPRATGDDLRCVCGKLMARLTTQGIELKCGRCRRVVMIDWSQVRDDRAERSCPRPELPASDEGGG
jgi:phage FluMu protein Com